MSEKSAPKAVDAPLNFIDDRLGSTTFLKRNMKKVFPDHWSFMLGEIALYSFVILLLTGTFLTLWFKPSMLEVAYDGSYTKLNGVMMSEAYASTLHISFDVRGGLLMRQIHHWAAILFMASIMAHMLRVFFTGAYRKPRELNWLIGIGLFTLGMVEGLFGYSLPDDLLSGTGLRITQGVAESIPVVGTYIYMFLFGGEFPGEEIIPRLYTLHVLLIPGIILALVTAHMMIMWHQKHTQMPGPGRTNENVVGYPMYPVFMAKTGAYFMFTFGALALLSTFAQINPIWLFGPYDPGAISSGSQPDFYMGILEGSLRIMPNWETSAFGHTVSWNVLIPALGPLGIIFTGAALFPFIERWVTGDQRVHHLNERPRNAPVRTGVGMAAVAFYGILWLAGGNDVIAEKFQVSLFATTWFFRFAVFLGPILAFVITRRICLGLQRSDAAVLHHGVESGTIRQTPEGEFYEVHVPANEQDRAVLLSKENASPAPAIEDASGIPAPGSRGPLGFLRTRLHRFWTFDDIPVEEHAHNGGHHDEHEAVEKEERKELTRG
ncbi:ubiquinol-cytochrome c reductase cytochrome b subunit [Actinomadura craniellae]|uniref:Cytochrome bc1 complex cytochrome b subunit n=1 Tax=Actinomadura craniellae TaxID=2231787 RepID=A0A365H1Z9_9ACTN|nr:ubiquinol-cytochrome c reductase cytochrome b subunit [Actinomadura craniellae]RAY13117.1 ubiquinol-cytochrome c reductase cytochrome b subunit [Actinomadura craniellae]